MPELDRNTARDWIERWDRQQEESLPDREDRFTALIDAVEEGADRPDPLVLDLGCGPGSLSVRLLGRLPQATVIGIDANPVALALARAAYPDLPGLRLADVDLRVPGWSGLLGLNRPADAAVSTTALHWLPEADLRSMYAELAQVLRPGGLLLNGDHFGLDPERSPVLAHLDRALRQREELRRFPGGHQESWHDWWDAAAADPVLSGTRRRTRATPRRRGSPRHQLDAARHPRRRPRPGRLRGDRHAVAARGHPPAVRGPPAHADQPASSAADLADTSPPPGSAIPAAAARWCPAGRRLRRAGRPGAPRRAATDTPFPSGRGHAAPR